MIKIRITHQVEGKKDFNLIEIYTDRSQQFIRLDDDEFYNFIWDNADTLMDEDIYKEAVKRFSEKED